MSIIRKPYELTTTPLIKALIYGQPGLGKSTLAVSAPQPLLIDCDNGVHRIHAQSVPDTVQVENYKQILDLLENEDLSNYKTLVVDTAGKLLDFMSSYLMDGDPKLRRGDGSLTLQGYGARKVLFQNFLRLVESKRKHLVFVAHDKEEKNNDVTIVRPEIGGSSAGDLIKELDLVGYMESVGKKRTICFDPCEKFYAKNTIGMGGVIEVPNIEQAGKNEFMQRVINQFATRQKERAKTAADYEALLALIDSNVENIKDAVTANEVTAWAQTLAHVWNSKLEASLRINKRAKEVGLLFDRNEGRYVDANAGTVANPTE